MRFLIGCFGFYRSLVSSYIPRDDVPPPERPYTDGTD